MNTSITQFIAFTLAIIAFTAVEEWSSRPTLALGCLFLAVVGAVILVWLTFWSAPTVAVAAAPAATTGTTLAPAPAANILPEGTYTTAKISAGDFDFFNYQWAIGQLTSAGTTTPITDWRVVNRVTGNVLYESGNLTDSTLVVGGDNGLTIGQPGPDPQNPLYVVDAQIGTPAKKQLALTTTGALQLQDATTGDVLYTVKE